MRKTLTWRDTGGEGKGTERGASNFEFRIADYKLTKEIGIRRGRSEVEGQAERHRNTGEAEKRQGEWVLLTRVLSELMKTLGKKGGKI